MKVTNVFKVIITAFLVITFTVSMISCKEAPAVEEQQYEEKGEGVTSLTTETEAREFAGLEIEGLNHVWQNNRWEYVDPNDNLVAGFWNGKEGKYAHTANVLRGEWFGLFAPKFPQDIEKMLSKEEWTEENWQSGKIKVPLFFMITKGGTIEEFEIGILNKANILAVSDLPSSKTDINSPIGYPDHVFFTPSDPPTPSGISLIEGNIKLSFLFANPQVAIDFSKTVMFERAAGNREIEVGTKLLELTNEVLSSYKLKLLSPSLDRDKYQLLLIIDNPKTGETLNFSFNNLLTDEKGRFIFMVPGLNLEEDASADKK